MKLVIDVETNSLSNPTQLWVVVCRDIESKNTYIFREVTKNEGTKRELIDLLSKATELIGHNLLGYDIPMLHHLLPDLGLLGATTYDTLIISKLVDYSRPGHSVEDYGREFGLEKGKFNDFTKYSPEMETYCIRDVDITERIFNKYRRYIYHPERQKSIRLEHDFQAVCNKLEKDGFAFNSLKAEGLLQKVEAELKLLDEAILSSFPPRLKLIREVTPKETKHGTISLTSIPAALRESIADFTVGAPFSYCAWTEFNPSSHKQIIGVLNDAGWKPTVKTKTHIDAERELNKLKRTRGRSKELDLRMEALHTKLNDLRMTGWKVNEENLDTLPPKAPASARTIAKRILLEARRRTLTEWLNLVWHEIEVMHNPVGMFGTDTNGTLILSGEKNNETKTNVGVQTISKNLEPLTVQHILKASMDCPSKTFQEWLKIKTVNVQSVKENANSTSITVIGQAQLENFFAAIATVTSVGTKNIQPTYKIISQRIHGRFYGIGAWSGRMAHQNPNTANIPNEFDTAGKRKLYGKELRSLWMAPKGRLLVGVDAEGIQLRIFAHYINDPEFTQSLISGKKEDKSDPHSLNQSILGPVCKSRAAAKRYIYALLLGAGAGKLREILDCDERSAAEAYDRLLSRYTGFAALKETIIPADAKRGWFVGLDGRAVRIPGGDVGSRRHLCMSGYLQNGEAVVMKMATLKWWPKHPEMDAKLVNFVHDEWQTECPNNMEIALRIAEMQADSLREVGEELKLKCPLAGSYWNDDTKDYTIDTNWSKTH